MRRQFVLTSTQVELDEMRSERLGDWWVHSGAEARVQVGNQICLVGLAADVVAGRPVSPAQLERSLSCGGLDALVEYCDQLAGRFIVLVESEGRLSVIPDGWASLQAFWAESKESGVGLSSSPGLLLELGDGSAGRRDGGRLQDDPLAKAREYRSVGDICPISGTRRVQPNHVLELPSGREQRLPLRRRDADFGSITDELSHAIRGLQMAHGGESWLPITAGLDSRWLAWAASQAAADVKFFTFSPFGDPTPDTTVGAEVAHRLGAQHSHIPLPARVSRSVRGDVTAVRGAWRDLGKMAEIEYLASLGRRILVLNGNGGEIVRGGYYGSGPRPSSRRLLRLLCLGPQASAFDCDGFDRWYDSLGSLTDSQLELDELFYWEQRMSHWGSDFYAEKENYVDELSPFCCRRILLAGPAIGRGRRAIQVGKALDSQPALKGVPVNPHCHQSALRQLAYVKSIGHLTQDAMARSFRRGRRPQVRPGVPQRSKTKQSKPIDRLPIKS